MVGVVVSYRPALVVERVHQKTGGVVRVPQRSSGELARDLFDLRCGPTISTDEPHNLFEEAGREREREVRRERRQCIGGGGVRGGLTRTLSASRVGLGQGSPAR